MFLRLLSLSILLTLSPILAETLSLEDFTTAAESLKSSFYLLPLEQLEDFTHPALQDALEYSRLAEADQEAADAIIVELLALKAEQTAVSPRFQQVQDTVFQSGSLDSSKYTYSDHVFNVSDDDLAIGTAPLKALTDTLQRQNGWFYNATDGNPTSSQGAWTVVGHYQESILEQVSFSFSYSPDTATTSNGSLTDENSTEQQRAVQTWNYVVATQTWTNEETGHSWTYNSDAKTWTHTPLQQDGATRATFTWQANHQSHTWQNITTGDVWEHSDYHFWKKVGAPQTPKNGFIDRWFVEPVGHSRYWYNVSGTSLSHSADVVKNKASLGHGKAPYSNGIWGEYASIADTSTPPTTLWIWSAVPQFARGAWIHIKDSSVSIYTFNEQEQEWRHNYAAAYPPPFLPPLIIAMHDEIITTYTALETQKIIAS